MRKYSLLIMLCLVFSLIGCSTQPSSTNKTSTNKTESKQVVQNKNTENNKKYNIDKITVSIEKDYLNDYIVYRNFDMAVIKEIAEANDIPLKIREMATHDDALIALQRGDVDVVPVFHELSERELTHTYSYFSGAVYKPNGEVLIPQKTFTMAVKADNEELLNFLNDMILKFNETGKMKELQKRYLGERNKIN